MSVIDRVKEHFAGYGTRQIEVPEWGEAPDKPLVIYYTPLTIADQQRITNAGNKLGELHKVIECLLIKAKDAQGNPVFTLADKQTLLKSADSNVIARVVREMMQPADPEDVEKK
jgi:hypothetical protein